MADGGCQSRAGASGVWQVAAARGMNNASLRYRQLGDYLGQQYCEDTICSLMVNSQVQRAFQPLARNFLPAIYRFLAWQLPTTKGFCCGTQRRRGMVSMTKVDVDALECVREITDSSTVCAPSLDQVTVRNSTIKQRDVA
ncbi:hypothetical protein LIA77_08594 [Sarocladium implicatum]|nr:hypothetical protein LIA77_08594 [Sarocladium implicatum]